MVPSIGFQAFFCSCIWNWRRLLRIQYVIVIHLMRWLTNFYDFRFKSTATAAIRIHPTKASLSQLVNLKNACWTWGHLGRTICNKIVLNLEKIPQKRMECFRLLFDHLAWIEHQFLSGIRDSRKAGNLWGMMRGVGGVRKSIHHSWLAKVLGLGLLCWGFKGIQEEIPSEEIPSEEANTLQIGSVALLRYLEQVSHHQILRTPNFSQCMARGPYSSVRDRVSLFYAPLTERIPQAKIKNIFFINLLSLIKCPFISICHCKMKNGLINGHQIFWQDPSFKHISFWEFQNFLGF